MKVKNGLTGTDAHRQPDCLIPPIPDVHLGSRGIHIKMFLKHMPGTS